VAFTERRSGSTLDGRRRDKNRDTRGRTAFGASLQGLTGGKKIQHEWSSHTAVGPIPSPNPHRFLAKSGTPEPGGPDGLEGASG
jgi:hypothetical protein